MTAAQGFEALGLAAEDVTAALWDFQRALDVAGIRIWPETLTYCEWAAEGYLVVQRARVAPRTDNE